MIEEDVHITTSIVKDYEMSSELAWRTDSRTSIRTEDKPVCRRLEENTHKEESTIDCENRRRSIFRKMEESCSQFIPVLPTGGPAGLHSFEAGRQAFRVGPAARP